MVEFDTKSGFSTGTYTIPTDETGYYLVGGHVGIGNFGDQDPFDLALYIDGAKDQTLFGLGTSTAGSEIPHIGGMVLIQLNAAQTLDLYCRVEDSGIVAKAAECRFEVYRIA